MLNLGTPKKVLLTALLSASTLALGCQQPVQSDQARGEVLYANCVSCHMPEGWGDQKIGAPAIAGLPEWYIEAQLLKFRSAQRGSHFDDIGGMKMRPMSLALLHERDVGIISAHVAKMPPLRKGATLQGDAKKGQGLFATCVACHGPTGLGNEALRAPPLAGQDDWYVVGQLQHFKAGIRGTNPADVSGATMRPMAMVLADEQAMRDVAAHIQTLSK